MPDGVSHTPDNLGPQTSLLTPDDMNPGSRISRRGLLRRTAVAALGAVGVTRVGPQLANTLGEKIPSGGIIDEIVPDALDPEKRKEEFYQLFPFMKQVTEELRSSKLKQHSMIELSEEGAQQFVGNYSKYLTEHICRKHYFDKLGLVTGKTSNTQLNLGGFTGNFSTNLKVDTPAFGAADFNISMQADLTSQGFLPLKGDNIQVETKANPIANKVLDLDSLPEYLTPILEDPSYYFYESIKNQMKEEGVDLWHVNMDIMDKKLYLSFVGLPLEEQPNT